MGRRARGSGLVSGDSEDPDRALVEQVKRELPHGTSAYNTLVRKYSGRVYGRAYAILRSSGDAEEVVQDVFLSVFRNLSRYRFERPFLHWLNTVTLNACRMTLRKRASEQRRRQAAQEQALPPERPVPPDVAMRRLVLELLDALDPGTRVPLLLRYVEGYTYPELAEELELSESAVKMRVARGSRKLRELYEARTTADARAEDGGGRAPESRADDLRKGRVLASSSESSESSEKEGRSHESR